MAYKRTVWVNNETKLNAQNLNNIEDGIVEAKESASEANSVASSANERANEALQKANNTETELKQYVDNKIQVVINDDDTIDLIIN